MDIRIIRQQPLPMRMIKIRSVINRRLLCGCATEDFGAPGVEVGIEVYDADGAVGFVNGA